MDTLARRRNGKGIGQTVAEELYTEGAQTRSEGVVTGENPVDGTGREPHELQGLERAGDEVASSSGAMVVGHPFWSQRAHDELQLQLARPDFLGNVIGTTGATPSGMSSTSTELRAVESGEHLRGPNGPPMVFGPAALRTTVGGDREGGLATAPAAADPTVPAPITVARESPIEAVDEEHGLSSRERNVLTQLKNALVQIAEQNSELASQNRGLRDRISKLEDERSVSQAAWQSAESNQDNVDQSGLFSGDNPQLEGQDCVIGREGRPGSQAAMSINYEQGFQQGYLAAKEALEATVNTVTYQPNPGDGGGFGLEGDGSVLRSSFAPTFGGGSPAMNRECTPPPNENRAVSWGCNTTPQGTPIPKGPPPQDVDLGAVPKGSRACLGVDSVNPLNTSNTSNVLNGYVGNHCFLGMSGRLEGQIPVGMGSVGQHVALGSATVGREPWAVNQWQGLGAQRDPPRVGPQVSNAFAIPPLPVPGVHSSLGVGSGGGGGGGSSALGLPELPEPSETSRDPFAPGDKVYWPLPVLADTHEEPDPATRASDWLEMVGPIMSDITAMSGIWWYRVLAEARLWYQRWTESPAVERGLIRPVPSLELQQLRFRRLESRAYAMLLAATPGSIRDEVVANREMHCVALLYHVLRIYQPGGLQERTTLLELLSNPGTTNSASEAVQKLRAWGRALNRALAMQISIPDASLMLRGLDSLADPLLKKHSQVSFRCSQARAALHLDHRPNLQSVREFVKVIQSEFDMLSLSGPSDSTKRPKLAAVQQQQQHQQQQEGAGGKGKENGGKSGEGKGKRKGNDQATHVGGDQGKPEGKEGGRGEGKPCSFYLTPKGCSKGRQCTFQHQFGRAKGESRCYNCGSTEHRQNDCTRPTAQGKGQNQGQGKTKGQRGSVGGSAAGSGSGNDPNSAASASQTNAALPAKQPGDGAGAPGGVPNHNAASNYCCKQ